MLAIDIVLLPPREAMEKIIKINRELEKTHKVKIKLNTTDRLPHITLMMGYIKEEDLESISHDVEQIVNKKKPLKLIGIAPAARHGVCVSISNTEELYSLHEEIVTKIKPYTHSEGTREAVCAQDQDIVGDASLGHIRHFCQRSSFEKFYPHITLDSNNYTVQFDPISFQANTVAICHLGAHCTCRYLLQSFTIPAT